MLYRIVRPIITAFFLAVYHPRIEGRENIPEDGALILAGNHTSNLDWLLLMSSTKRTVHFLGKHTLFKGIGGPIMRAMKVIPVDRTKNKNPNVLTAARKVLKEGGVIGIFPEGTINRTKETIMPFKIGAVYLSQKCTSPIVAFAITGSYKPFINDLKITFLPSYIVTDSELSVENSRLMEKIRCELGKELL